MPSPVFTIASDFLAGSILTLALPLGLLIAVIVWLVVLTTREARER